MDRKYPSHSPWHCSAVHSPSPGTGRAEKADVAVLGTSDVCMRQRYHPGSHVSVPSAFQKPGKKICAPNKCEIFASFQKEPALFSIGEGEKGAVNVVIRSRHFFHSFKAMGVL